MSQDTLSEVLRTVRLRGALFYDVSCGPEWAAELPSSVALASAVIPNAEHVIEFHLLAKGQCWAAVIGQPPIRMEAGDIVMFPQGDAHVMSSAPGLRAEALDVDWIYATAGDPKPITLHMGVALDAEGKPLANAATNLICGFLGCDLRPFNPLIAALPPIVHVQGAEDREWITRTLLHAVAESNARRPGSEAVLHRMSEMLFVSALRQHLERMPESSIGWLAGLRDRFVGKALSLMHERPGREWTIEALADAVGLSRSALHERFVSLVGQPPMQYLANWRMQIGARLLRESRATVASIAQDVGYDSEAAFSRAFKRVVGMPPAAWRRAQLASA